MPLSMPFLIVASASAYAVAMIAMKIWAGNGFSIAIVAVVIAAVVIGVVAEYGALREERLVAIYVMILGAECLLIGLASVWLFGESFTIREVAGAGLIVAGTALAWI